LKLFAKLGVFMLAVTLFASPTMACLLPNAALTSAEKECCRKMAHDCEQAATKESHSCCQRTGTVGAFGLIKDSSPNPAQLTLIAVHHAPNVTPALPDNVLSSLLQGDSEIHGPPGLALVTTSILRI
jgi:hypothetical protein